MLTSELSLTSIRGLRAPWTLARSRLLVCRGSVCAVKEPSEAVVAVAQILDPETPAEWQWTLTVCSEDSSVLAQLRTPETLAPSPAVIGVEEPAIVIEQAPWWAAEAGEGAGITASPKVSITPRSQAESRRWLSMGRMRIDIRGGRLTRE
jgi:hypothetical protein